ncbi:MAG: dTMP kinase [Methanosphaera sp.]|nr:dTMP kinase [Methanosphaera sp.]
MYIVLEGIDGSGKTTQTEILYQWLKDEGYNTRIIREPTQSDIGKLIRRKLQDPNSTSDINQQILTLLFATDRLTLKEEILEAKGSTELILLSDRSFYSSIAYQDNSSIDTQWIFDVNKYTPRPDITILLDLDEKIAIKRCDNEECFENLSFLELTRRNYHDLLEKEDNMILVDSSGSIDKVQEDIRKIIKEKIEKMDG